MNVKKDTFEITTNILISLFYICFKEQNLLEPANDLQFPQCFGDYIYHDNDIEMENNENHN